MQLVGKVIRDLSVYFTIVPEAVNMRIEILSNGTHPDGLGTPRPGHEVSTCTRYELPVSIGSLFLMSRAPGGWGRSEDATLRGLQGS